MAKQTMGVPVLSWQHRNDNKMYSLTTPQSPLVRTGLYDVLGCDEYPLGTNACIAVMAYTVGGALAGSCEGGLVRRCLVGGV